MFIMFLDNLKPLTFTFFKFKVPNFKLFLWNIGTGNMSESYREAKAVLDNVKSSAWSYFKFLSVCGVIGEYSAAACTRSAAFLEQVITTSVHAADEVESLHTKNDRRSKSAVVMHTKDTCKRSFTICNSYNQKTTDATIVMIFWVTLQNHKLCRKRAHSCSQSLRHWGNFKT